MREIIESGMQVQLIERLKTENKIEINNRNRFINTNDTECEEDENCDNLLFFRF